MQFSYTLLTTILFTLCISLHTRAENIVYSFTIQSEISPSVTRLTENAIKDAERRNAKYILVQLDTYGGLVDDADKIRTMLLRSKIPTLVFIKNNAASAGALISIACDSIYMASGAAIGAASVVNQSGELMPEKYQSYMRKKMRATAEETGRNPLIAEGMTDESLEIEGIKEKGKIVTLTTDEALKYGFCNAKAENVNEILSRLPDNPTLVNHQSNLTESVIMWLINPAVSGVLLLLIFGGLYFEFKAPGTLFPAAVSLLAAALYFAPLYLEGLAANWEIIAFAIGIVLILAEIFVIPGFGLAGISGIVLTISGLALAMLRNVNFDFSFVSTDEIGRSFFMVVIAMITPLILLVAFGQQLFNSPFFEKLAPKDNLSSHKGFSVQENTLKNLVGASGKTITDLRPAGKATINNERLEVISEGDFISSGTEVKVLRIQGNYLVVTKI
ncbi:MAG TPA: NfeD family protein [Chitinophagales bacterium]|nr:NfeD family protein [Chitinophagales bacterium]